MKNIYDIVITVYSKDCVTIVPELSKNYNNDSVDAFYCKVEVFVGVWLGQYMEVNIYPIYVITLADELL